MVQTQGPPLVAAEPLTMKALLESGVHFGAQTRRWNPKMKRYIIAERNGIHIIDLQQTMELLHKACRFVTETVAQGGTILMVGTKKQAQEAIFQEAQRCGAFFINQRWLGGTLTNFRVIQSRIDYLVRLEERKLKGQFSVLGKKEAGKLDKEIVRLNRYLGGIKAMTKHPGAIFVIDLGKEKTTVTEAQKVGVPLIALVDTDCDPNQVDYPIPGNDDAIRSVRLMASRIAEAVAEGNRRRIAAHETDEVVEATVAADADNAVAESISPEPVATITDEDFTTGEQSFGGND